MAALAVLAAAFAAALDALVDTLNVTCFPFLMAVFDLSVDLSAPEAFFDALWEVFEALLPPRPSFIGVNAWFFVCAEEFFLRLFLTF